jgi:ATP-binding cassette subfamily B protein
MTAKGIKFDKKLPEQIPTPSIAHIIVNGKLHHYVVVYKIGTHHIRFMDPSTGRIEKLSHDEFEAMWSGILIIAAPGGNYVSLDKEVSNKKRFFYLLKPHKGILIQAFIGALIYSVLGFSTSVYVQKLTDYIIVFELRQALIVAGIAMLFIIGFQIFISVLKNKMILRTGQLIDARLILGYYKHLLKLPQKFFDSMRVGEIISRINDAGKIRQFLSDTSINIILNILILVLSVIILFLFHWKLALIVTLMIPAFALVYFITNSLNRKQERIIMEKGADLESQLVESLQNIRTVKQLNLQNNMSLEVEWRFIDFLKSTYKSGINLIFSNSSSELITRSITLLLLWTGSIFILNRELTIGQLMSFYTIVGYMAGPAAGLVGINRIYQNANIAADRLFEIIDLENYENTGNFTVEDFRGKDIIFKDVNFSYGTRGDLFAGLNLTIKSGKITGIIGESGSGKSTISNLISGLYRINEGALLLGNHSIEQYKVDSIFNSVAIVPQHTDLFSGTLLKNIVPGDSDADIEKVMDICLGLGLRSFLETIPGGLNTFIGENGYTLSGGERQRISIARALYRNPSILILDEATSSLDSEAERMLLELLKAERAKGMTIILISHRLSTIRIADKIIYMDKGKVLEEGDHANLVSAGGRYSKFLSRNS